MRLQSIKRFEQQPACCAISSCACISHYYNSEIDYEVVGDIAAKLFKPCKVEDEGLSSPEIGMLLNVLGFKKVTIISTDLNIVDYDWQGKNKAHIKKQLKILSRYKNDNYSSVAEGMIKFLSNKKCTNKILVDNQFGKYIRKMIDRDLPILVSYLWNVYFGIPKVDENDNVDSITGQQLFHVVVAYAYNKYGLRVIDSHRENYRYRLKKFRKGRYLMPWEELMLSMAEGDIIVPDNYKQP